mgnify:CR=1 FL=1
MGKHVSSIYTLIRDKIIDKGVGKIHFLSDFTDYDPESVRQAFVRLVKDEVVIRLSPGIFLFPLKTRFGVAYPSDYEIAKEIARRDSASVLPAGMTAANMVGLSEQVPMKSMFITDGAARTVNVNGRTIIFKRGVPKNFAYKSKTMPLIVAGMKAMGKDDITEDIEVAVADIIKPLKQENDKIIRKNTDNLKDILSISIPTTGARLTGNVSLFLEPIILTFSLINNGFTQNYFQNEYLIHDVCCHCGKYSKVFDH